MTTEFEQEFFKVFGIEPKIYKTDGRDIDDNGDVCSWYIEEVYPEITDRKLLEMICINSYFCGVNFHNLWVKNPDEIKAVILYEIIRWYKEQKYGHEKCKHQIQQLFKEEEYNKLIEESESE